MMHFVRHFKYDVPYETAVLKRNGYHEVLTPLLKVKVYAKAVSGAKQTLIRQVSRLGLAGEGILSHGFLVLDTTLGRFTVRATQQGYLELCRQILPTTWKSLVKGRYCYLTEEVDVLMRSHRTLRENIHRSLRLNSSEVREIGEERVLSVINDDFILSTYDLISKTISTEVVYSPLSPQLIRKCLCQLNKLNHQQMLTQSSQ